jgi:phage terminase large subunit GpA-like protein
MTEDQQYAAVLADLCAAHHAFTPPQATTVSAGATQNLVIRQPGTAGGPWDKDETPYMVEPMDILGSRLHEACIFVGPARTGKTLGLLLGAMSHIVVNDPGDILFIQMTQDKAREFSKTDVRRAIDYSPNLSNMLSSNASDRNTHDIMFRNGMWLRIAWPTVSNVSGSTYRFSFITDLDRIPNAENVDGEGPLFDLARKRTTTFLSRGMTLAESSPGIEITDPGWKPATPHEAPPVSGVVGLYNRGDRRRWYWKCPHCESDFEAAPGLGLFHLPPDDQLIETVRTTDLEVMAKSYGSRIIPPCCGAEIPFSEKQALNRTGRWVSESEMLGNGKPKNKIASYWLGGVAAAYQSWESLVLRYLQGLRDYAITGSEESLKATINTDQGAPYMARHLVEMQNGALTPAERAADLPRYVVPEWTRCLVASVDVQGGSTARFEVQVHAVGPYLEQQLVDRYAIKDSKREGMGSDFAPIDPAGYAEDWNQLTEKVLMATYRTGTENREIKIRLCVVDTGGEDGVTDRAYAWWRSLKPLGFADRAMLYKGANTKGAPILRKTWQGKRNDKDKGDVPVYVCNPNLLSDAVAAGLRRQTPGPGYIHFPKPKHPTQNPGGWLPQAFFDELGAEVRGKDGVWEKVRKRNESFDLCRMIRAGLLRLGLDKIKDWSVVPAWLAPLELNSEIMTVEARRAMKEDEVVSVPLPTPQVRIVNRPKSRRRAVASPYLG